MAPSYFGLLLLGLCLVSSASTAMNSRQSPGASSATALISLDVPTDIFSAISTAGTIGQFVAPAMQSLFRIPLQLLRQLVSEMVNFMRGRSWRELFSLRFLQQVLSRLPDRAVAYYRTLVDMESQCMQRTLCDLAEVTSRRLPKFAEQAVLMYLNSYSDTRPMFQVMIHGITTRKCPQIYSECDPEQFLARLSGNVSETIASTIAPLQVAFADLINATTSTLSSLSAEDKVPPPVETTGSKPGPNRFGEEDNVDFKPNEPNFGRPSPFPTGSSMANFNGDSPNRIQMRPPFPRNRFQGQVQP